MSRPCKCRRVAFIPGVTYFKPAGIPLRALEEIHLSVEEAEALRLKDLEGLEQEQGAEKMNISRPTFQRILASARQKIADALLNGKAIKIEGGNFEISYRRFRCHNGHEWETDNSTTTSCPTCSTSEIHPVPPAGFGCCRRNNNISNMEVNYMKIAVVTENETTICQHFGYAPYYMVFTVENGKIVSKEKRDKTGHHTFGGQHEEHHHGSGEKHGCDAASQVKHASMISNITDCQVLLAGGMGYGARYQVEQSGIKAVTGVLETDPDKAVLDYLNGTLQTGDNVCGH